jgi:membrane protease YdiL (CAAX protease family)
MPQLLYFGLAFALLASPLVLALFRRLHFNQFSPVPRIALWVAAAVVVGIAATNISAWRTVLGLAWPTWQIVGLAVAAAAVLLLAIVASQFLLAKFRLLTASPKQVELQKQLLHSSFGHRFFVVATAAVTEEVLYRGYAIGVGQHLLGNLWLACILSVAVFTLAHIRWGLANLIPVFLATLVITLLFAVTKNLLACIIVHAILDGLGHLVVPAIMARKRSAPVTG